MLPAAKHPTMAELRQLSTLRDLDRQTLNGLANRLAISRAAPGTELLPLGSRQDHTLYLLEGKLRLTAADGKTKEFDHHHPTARDPVARLRPSQYQVVTVSAVYYLRIDNSLLEELEQPYDSTTLLDSYEVSEDAEFTGMPAQNRLMIKIYQDLNADRLSLPTLPQIAHRIGQAMQDPHLDATKLAKLISVDPSIAAKLLKAANSARFGGKVMVNTLPHAVARLGLHQTHHLVMSFAVRELFRTGSGTLKQQMRDLWRHSRRVAAISHVLAARIGGHYDPPFALLAGLLHDIGVIAILSYARQCPELTQDEHQLQQVVDQLRSQLGGAIVRRWHLPEELALVAQEADHWVRDPGHHPDYVDLVIIAQLHCFVGTPRATLVPHINTVPAYRRLDLGQLTPDMSLQLLEEAGEEIREVEQLLGD